MKELVTVIVPAYNEEEYLEECLESLRAQTYKNLEIIVIDDGSKDRTFEIAKRFEINDSRFKVLKKENGGLSSARNMALDIYKGDYVYFLDSDDHLYSTSIEYLLSIINKYNVDIVYSFTNKQNADEMILDSNIEIKNKEEAIWSYLRGENFSESCCAKLFKRYIFDDLRFEEGRIHEDTFITYQILDKVNSIAITKFNGYISTIRENSITHQKFGNKNYDKVIAAHRIYDYYSGTCYETLAYNKYVGCLLYFIIKTNKLDDVSFNSVALKEFHKLINTNGLRKIKIKFFPFVLIDRLGLLKKVSY